MKRTIKHTDKKKYIFILQKELKTFRKKHYKLQNGCCPILQQQIKFEDSVVDHKHKRKDEPYNAEDGKGLIRGVLHFQANVIEGKIANSYKRYGLDKFISLPDLLRNIATYIEAPIKEPYFVHPSAIPKIKKHKLGKRDTKRIFKYWKTMYPRRKLPTVPTSGIVTKEWETYIIKSKEVMKNQ